MKWEIGYLNMKVFTVTLRIHRLGVKMKNRLLKHGCMMFRN